MTRLRILCTQKTSSKNNPLEITHIGGVNGRGEKWKITVKEAVEGIQSGNFEFYLVENFAEIPVIVTSENPNSLFATGNGFLHNLLEDLPDCP
ncbi:hypothetical protein [Algoriphagus pacificus]|uniref:DUF3892 domain-containing protein n=1 Tax=Algoriphagus pacificus TaxID=2811234 RepID=A0ABS3CLT4_9BACT|nr:hypothetical protein [Algoriphagus pacificus]MBN7818045.1 hypothetical protein [Algoriphagus pacificus]